MKRTIITLTAVYALLCPIFTQSAHAQSDHAAPIDHDKSKLHSQQQMKQSQYDIQSAEGRSYRIFIAEPEGTAPENGWPVIWLLDGNMTFPLALKMKPQALLIGIGYPLQDRNTIVAERYFDLTSKAQANAIPLKAGMAVPQTGGNGAFIRFLFTKVRPDIEARFDIDRTRQTLYGHSLGGLFALNILLHNQYSFATYCAADPAIWWNHHEIFTRFASFDDVKAKGLSTRILISLSGKKAARTDMTDSERRKTLVLRAGPNGKDVYEKLKSVSSLDLKLKIYDKETHGTMVVASVRDCLGYADVLHNAVGNK